MNDGKYKVSTEIGFSTMSGVIVYEYPVLNGNIFKLSTLNGFVQNMFKENFIEVSKQYLDDGLVEVEILNGKVFIIDERIPQYWLGTKEYHD